MRDQKTAKDENKGKPILFWTLLIIGAFVFVFSLWYLNFRWLHSMEATERGTFGDMFGAANSLFSGLAFAILIITLFMQREELIEQKEESKKQTEAFNAQVSLMEEHRKHLDTQDELLNNQNQTMKAQLFDNLYFNYLNEYHRSRERVQCHFHNKGILRGNDCLDYINKKPNELDKAMKESSCEDHLLYLYGFLHFLNEYLNENLNKNLVDIKTLRRYVLILRSALTDAERKMVLHPEADPKLKKLNAKLKLVDESHPK